MRIKYMSSLDAKDSDYIKWPSLSTGNLTHMGN